jgi:CSLREA domain-containing protein
MTFPPGYPRFAFKRFLKIRTLNSQLLGLAIIASLSALPFLVHGLARTKRRSEQTASEQNGWEPARLRETVSVYAAGRGNPTINLSDGHELVVPYVGPEALRSALEQNQAEPLSLAAADFDEDGVPDLVSGYAFAGRGIVTLLRGNVDSIYPNAPEAKQRRANGTFTEAPFLSPAQAFDAPVAADFIGAGDFDADGHWDVVTASRGGTALYLLTGNGHGDFSEPRRIELPGVLTAFATGEVNRADGIADIVVGVSAKDGARVLVFEGPNGALQAKPESLSMPGEVTALVLGQLDNSYEMDVAVGSGNQLVLLHGRDRRLSLDAEHQQQVQPARLEARALNAPIKSLAIGDFSGQHEPDIALLTDAGQVEILSVPLQEGSKREGQTSLRTFRQRSLTPETWPQATTIVRAKMSSLEGDDLVVVDREQTSLVLLHVAETSDAVAASAILSATRAPVAILPMRLNSDAKTDVVLLQQGQSSPLVMSTAAAQTFIVNSTADTNDGTCNAANCTLREAINAANANVGTDTINFNIPGQAPYTISPTSRLPILTDSVVIDATSQPGFAGKPIVELNGTNAGTGSFAFGLEAGSNTFRGLVINRFDGQGLYVTTINGGHLVEGNYIGTNISGSAASPNNPSAIQFDSGNNIIGGTVVAARNVLVGGTGKAISMPDPHCIGNLIEGNFIGTDATGQAVLGGNGIGIGSNGAKNNTIGGTTPQARNIISTGRDPNLAETFGIDIGGSAAGNLVQGNYLGTDVTGTVALGNGTGVSMNQSPNNTVGGTVSSSRNIVSASQFAGVFLYQPLTSNNLVQGNYIGTDLSGTQPLGNITNGVGMGGCNHNTIGGVVAGAGNLISANLNGVHLYFAENVANHDNTVQGNLIGTDVTGSVALGNRLAGVDIQNADSNLIGGNTAGARNVISGNLDSGFAIYGGPTAAQGQGSANNNRIEGNFVGTNAAGTAKIPNARDGIAITITQGSAANTIGGATADKRNVISGNGRNGISIGIRLIDPLTGQLLPGTGGTGITVQNNYIGTDVSGNNCLGNTLDGVFVDADSTTNTFSDNLIACNGRNGVFIPQNSNPAVRILIDGNDIFSNAALGIDLGNPGITPNDPQDTDGGANLQQNFPTLTAFAPSVTNPGADGRAIPSGTDSTISVNGTMNSTPNTTFTVQWTFSADAQCVNNQPQSHSLKQGKIGDLVSNGNGDLSFSFPFPFPPGITSGVMVTKAIQQGVGNTSEFSACLGVKEPPTVQLSSSGYSAAENDGSRSVTVTRSGDSSGASSVNYATSDAAGAANCNTLNSGKASSRCDYETTVGTLRFAAGETSKNILIPVVDDAYAEGDESFTVTLSSATGASLGSPSVATVTIIDNDTTTGSNPISQAGYFVRMQYLDFFSREPDTSGLNFWTNEITSCGSNTQCTEIKRINVSAAFYLSIEFRDTGYLVERIYRAAYGNGMGTSTLGGTHQFSVPVIRFEEFLPDTQEIGRGVVVGQTGWEQVLENNKQAFLNAFVLRARFTGAFPAGMTPAQYVDALNANAGGALSTSERNQLVNDLATSAKTRAQVLRAVAEDPDLNTAENNRAFVLMQFYGYLRRNPNDAPDADYTGYDFWLSKLNQFNGNFVNAEMVKAFIQSDEYRHRFGP